MYSKPHTTTKKNNGRPHLHHLRHHPHRRRPLKGILKLTSTIGDIRNAREEVALLVQEGTNLKQLLLLIHRTLDGISVASIDRETVAFGDKLVKQAKELTRKFRKIVPRIKDMIRSTRIGRLGKKVKWLGRKREVEVLRSSVGGVKVCLGLFMHCVQIQLLAELVKGENAKKPDGDGKVEKLELEV